MLDSAHKDKASQSPHPTTWKTSLPSRVLIYSVVTASPISQDSSSSLTNGTSLECQLLPTCRGRSRHQGLSSGAFVRFLCACMWQKNAIISRLFSKADPNTFVCGVTQLRLFSSQFPSLRNDGNNRVHPSRLL